MAVETLHDGHCCLVFLAVGQREQEEDKLDNEEMYERLKVPSNSPNLPSHQASKEAKQLFTSFKRI